MNKLTVTCAAALLSALPAMAQSEEPTPGRALAETIFGSMETNSAGQVDMGQFTIFGRSIFVAMDHDSDSTIDFDEFTGFDFGFDAIAEEAGMEPAYRAAQKILFAFWDHNGDGAVSRDEYQKSVIWDFQRADIDNNAVLTEDEFLHGYIVNRAYRAALTGH